MKKYSYIYILIVLFSCKKTITSQQEVISEKNVSEIYQANWESLKKHETPDWFLDAKFGIYCHWGPYSVPAFENEWYAHWMYTNKNNPEYERGLRFYEHHVATYGPLDQFGYKDFIPMFKAKKFDPAAWAELFMNAGAKFAGPVSEHADGFAMWDSKLTRWNAKNMGPKRDIMGELSTEIRKRGMKFIATYHRQWLYAWYPTWDKTTDASNPEFADLYGPEVNRGDFQYPLSTHEIDEGITKHYPLADEEFNQEWLDRLKEIVDNYDPDMVWFDNKVDVIGEQYRKDFLAYYYNQAAQKNQEVVATYKFYDFAKGTAVLDLERARMSEKKPFPWLTDDSIDWKSWSHISNPDYKSANRVIDFLVDVVSKNGCLLLNIPPRADGTIPEPVKERLLQIGNWLKINGEAIYGTRPWKIYGEGSTEVTEGHLSENQNPDNVATDIRFTTKGEKLYAIILAWPKSGTSLINSLKLNSELFPKKITSVTFLADRSKINFEQKDDGLHLNLPKQQVGDYAFVFKIE